MYHRCEIQSLLKENREIRTVLKLANSDKNRTIDIQDTERLVDLIDNLDMYSAQADAEEARIKELDAEVQILLPEMFTLSSSFTFVKRVFMLAQPLQYILLY